jgi:hypothetical protein
MIEVAHVEAGLRSFDLSMPEEINRMVTDTLSDFFFVTEKSGIDNLIKKGKAKEKIHFVGHVIIDNIFYQLDRLNNEDPLRLSTCSGLFFLTNNHPSAIHYLPESKFLSNSVYAHGTKKHGAQEPRMELKPVELYAPEMSAEREKKVFVNKGCISCHSINVIESGALL